MTPVTTTSIGLVACCLHAERVHQHRPHHLRRDRLGYEDRQRRYPRARARGQAADLVTDPNPDTLDIAGVTERVESQRRRFAPDLLVQLLLDGRLGVEDSARRLRQGLDVPDGRRGYFLRIPSLNGLVGKDSLGARLDLVRRRYEFVVVRCICICQRVVPPSITVPTIPAMYMFTPGQVVR